MSAFWAIVRRDITLAMRRKAEVITAVFFFVVVAALFPLGIGPDMATLERGLDRLGAMVAEARLRG